MSEVLDNRQRTATELWSAAAALPAAALLLLYPQHCFPVWPAVSTCAGLAAALLGGLRLWQGLELLHYRRGLSALPTYRLAPQRIPAHPGQLFLGLGFGWHRCHSQRLAEARAPQRGSRPRARSGAADGDPRLHGVGVAAEAPVWIDEAERAGHVLVLGTTRVGKTRLAELLVAQDIRRGHCTIVFDPKGDPALFLRMAAEARRAGRLDRLRFFHLGFPHLSAAYNPLGDYGRITEVATRLAAQLPGQGESAAFREFAWRYTHVIARALAGLGRVPDVRAIARYLDHIDPLLLEYCEHWLDRSGPGDWRMHVANRLRQAGKGRTRASPGRDPRAVALAGYLRDADLHDEIADGLLSTHACDHAYYEKLTANLRPLLEKLGSGATGRLLVPSTGCARPQLNWSRVIRRAEIVYVGLDALSDTEVAGAVGNSMFADLASLAGRLYKQDASAAATARAPVSIHADEFNELAGPEFVPLLNKAGGAGIRVTAYTQTLADIETSLEDSSRAGQLLGNLNSLVMLRVRDERTAELLTRQLPEVRVYSRLTESRCTDGADPGSGVDFVAQTADRLEAMNSTLVTTADLISLPRGHAYALLHGGQLYKLRLPLLAPDPLCPPGIETAASWCAP